MKSLGSPAQLELHPDHEARPSHNGGHFALVFAYENHIDHQNDWEYAYITILVIYIYICIYIYIYMYMCIIYTYVYIHICIHK